MIVGIDPGITGAVAFLSDSPRVVDTPTLATGTKHEYDVRAMLAVFGGAAVERVFIERQRSMPKQGVSSTFKIGYGYGLWVGIVSSLGFPYELVEPSTWKKVMMAGMPKEKQASILKAKQLFPSVDLRLAKHHGRADALLIAEYGRMRCK